MQLARGWPDILVCRIRMSCFWAINLTGISLIEQRDFERKDWDVMATQALDSPFHLDPVMCDPIAAGLLSDQDANDYFDLFAPPLYHCAHCKN
jgi:hypothetical protein